MSHFAQLNEENIVINIVVGNNDDPNGDEGYQWLLDNIGGRFVKTSYNGNSHNKYAGIGDYFDEDRDAFILPKPYPSWVLDEETLQWKAPVLAPADYETVEYDWDEDTLSWIPVDI